MPSEPAAWEPGHPFTDRVLDTAESLDSQCRPQSKALRMEQLNRPEILSTEC